MIVIVNDTSSYNAMKRRLRGEVSFDLETTGLYPWQSQIVSMGFGTADNQYIIPWDHEDSFWRPRLGEIVEELNEIINDCELITQNGKFDALMMRVHHGVMWIPTFDTMLAHYLLDENSYHDLEYLAAAFLGASNYDVPLAVKQGKHGIKALAKYQALDLDYTRQLKFIFDKKLKADSSLNRVFRHILMPCVRLFIEIEFDGVYIDQSKFDIAETYLLNEVATALNKLKEWEPAPKPKLNKKGQPTGKMIEFNWGSTQQLGKLLFEDLKIPIVEKTGKGAPSTSESVLKRIDHPMVESLLKFRGAKQQLSFFIEGWKPYLVKGYLHPSFKLHGTVTGRLSAEHPNLQQVPRDPRIRQLIAAPDDWELIEADLSQIELRIAAELSNDREMVYAYSHGIDVHWLTLLRELGRSAGQADVVIETASTLMQREVTYSEALDILLKAGPDACAEVNPVWKELRKKAKAINFGYLYGMWWRKFIIYARDNYEVKVTEREAQASRKSFFDLYKDLPAWHNRQKNYAQRNGYVMSLSGRKRHLPDALSSEDTPQRAEALRQAINAPVQSFANELNLMAALQLRKEYPRTIVRICGTVHDAILARVKKPHVVEVSRRLLEIMRHPNMLDELDIKLRIPIEAELKVGAWSRGVSLEKWIKNNPEYAK